MSTPRFYSWDDAGGPGRALTGNLQNKLKQILVPCLVTGYGDKPGAGWTIGHEHANGFSLINADGNVINFVSGLPAQAPYPAMSNYTIHVYAASSLSGTNGPFIEGANLCSGSYRAGQDDVTFQRHSIGRSGYPLTDGLYNLQWTLVSDDRTFVLSLASEGSNSYPDEAITLYVGGVALDDTADVGFVALGGSMLTYGTSGEGYAYCGGYSAPIDLATGLASTTEVGAEPFKSRRKLEQTRISTRISSRLSFQQPRLVFGGAFCGRLRGVVYDDVLTAGYGWLEYLRVLGFSNDSYDNRAKVVEISGHNYAFARSLSGNSILTDNPEFWV